MMQLSDKVNITYNDSHNMPNTGYSKRDIATCRKKYFVPGGDARATKKNITAYVKARDSGYKRDFDDFCYEKGFADGRKTRNGKKAMENNAKYHIAGVVLLAFILFCVCQAYQCMALFIPLVAITYVLYRVFGKYNSARIVWVIIIVLCILLNKLKG